MVSDSNEPTYLKFWMVTLTQMIGSNLNQFRHMTGTIATVNQLKWSEPFGDMAHPEQL